MKNIERLSEAGTIYICKQTECTHSIINHLYLSEFFNPSQQNRDPVWEECKTFLLTFSRLTINLPVCFLQKIFSLLGAYTWPILQFFGC